MQAIVKQQRAPGLEVTSVRKPAAGPGEVLIAVRHAGVCGTDLHIAVGAVMDPMGNAFHAVLTADVSGSTVFIVGCGPIGCFAVGVARAAGAARVIASDVNPKRLELARTMGAHVLINAARDDVVRTV